MKPQYNLTGSRFSAADGRPFDPTEKPHHLRRKPIAGLLLLLALTLGNLSAWGQRTFTLNDLYSDFRNSRRVEGLAGKSAEIVGSPFDNEEFIMGEIVTTSNSKYVDIPLRLNIYNDAIEFKNSDGTALSIAAPETIGYVMMGDRKFVYSPYLAAGKILRGFFEVLEEGKATLLLRRNIVLRDAVPPQAYAEAKPASLQRLADDYYVRLQSDEAKKVTNRKDIVEILQDHAAELEAFLKKNKTKFNKPGELTDLIKYYNSLQ